MGVVLYNKLVYIYIYIYIVIERERCIHTYVYIYIYIYTITSCKSLHPASATPPFAECRDVHVSHVCLLVRSLVCRHRKFHTRCTHETRRR